MDLKNVHGLEKRFANQIEKTNQNAKRNRKDKRKHSPNRVHKVVTSTFSVVQGLRMSSTTFVRYHPGDGNSYPTLLVAECCYIAQAWVYRRGPITLLRSLVLFHSLFCGHSNKATTAGSSSREKPLRFFHEYKNFTNSKKLMDFK